MMAKFNDIQDNIIEALAEAEKFTLSQASAPSSFPIFSVANSYESANKSGMTKTEIENLVKSTLSSSQLTFLKASSPQLSSLCLQLSKANI